MDRVGIPVGTGEDLTITINGRPSGFRFIRKYFVAMASRKLEDTYLDINKTWSIVMLDNPWVA